MTQEVIQWLAEIKSLQQQLAQAYRDRDAARTKEADWRELYNKEAEQRRTETKLAKDAIDALKVEIQQLRGLTPATLEETNQPESELASLLTVEALQAKLSTVLQERDRLAQALVTEQQNHAQTRTSLTIALGDAIEQFAKGRGTREIKPDDLLPTPTPHSTPLPEPHLSPKQLPEAKTPLLQLPPIIPGQSPA